MPSYNLLPSPPPPPPPPPPLGPEPTPAQPTHTYTHIAPQVAHRFAMAGVKSVDEEPGEATRAKAGGGQGDGDEERGGVEGRRLGGGVADLRRGCHDEAARRARDGVLGGYCCCGGCGAGYGGSAGGSGSGSGSGSGCCPGGGSCAGSDGESAGVSACGGGGCSALAPDLASEKRAYLADWLHGLPADSGGFLPVCEPPARERWDNRKKENALMWARRNRTRLSLSVRGREC